MTQEQSPFYNPFISYEENYQSGPFGAFTKKPTISLPSKPSTSFLGYQINLPFGIPAGPLLNSNYIKAAFEWGFDLCVYKTVRTQYYPSHPLPNVLAVHPKGKLSANIDIVLADQNYQPPLSITNSFGVPSFDPEKWQPDMAKAVESAKTGQIVIGSFQGTAGITPNIEDDYARAAYLVNETKAPVLEANLSCPNEGANKLLCFDIDKVERIVHAIKTAVPDKPLLLKLAYFKDHTNLHDLLKKIGHIIDGISTINTLSAQPVTHDGQPALGLKRPTGGICGEAIRWAGEEMVSRLHQWRLEHQQNFAIIGVGGVSQPEHYQTYRHLGADAVMSATGAMWNPALALEIKKAMKQN